MQNLKKVLINPESGNHDQIPKDWNFEPLNKFVKIISGEYFPYDKFVNYGIRVLKIDNVMYGNINWDNQTFLPESYLESHRVLVLRDGDIVIALNRPITNDEVKVARLSIRDTPSILYQRVGKLEFNTNNNIERLLGRNLSVPISLI